MVRKDTTAPQDFQKPSILYNLTHKRRRSIVVHSAGFSSFLSGLNFQFCPVHSIFRFSFFCSNWPKTKKSAVLFVYLLYKKSALCLKMTADLPNIGFIPFIFRYSFFCQSDQKMKNEKWNEPAIYLVFKYLMLKAGAFQYSMV